MSKIWGANFWEGLFFWRGAYYQNFTELSKYFADKIYWEKCSGILIKMFNTVVDYEPIWCFISDMSQQSQTSTNSMEPLLSQETFNEIFSNVDSMWPNQQDLHRYHVVIKMLALYRMRNASSQCATRFLLSYQHAPPAATPPDPPAYFS